MKKSVQALGIMNGTSLDGIDYSLIEVSFDFKKILFKKHFSKPIPKKIKQKLLLAAIDKSTTYEISQLHFELGVLYQKHLQDLKNKMRWDIIGLHGQTIHHEGKKASLQIGAPSFLSSPRKTPIYFDFRSADIAVGGQGAPFAPFFQKFITPKGATNFGFHNLGGISNLTIFNNKKIYAFDTGPANILIDTWMQENKKGTFDYNGSLASKGLPDPICVNQFLKHPYFNKTIPKSTGRETFNLDFIKKWGKRRFTQLNFNDQLATLTELTALSIAQSYKLLKNQPNTLYFYGGGVYNSYLMSRIQFNMPDTQIISTDELGWPSQAFEASTFAFLAAARYFDKTVHLPQVTGAKKITRLGSVY